MNGTLSDTVTDGLRDRCRCIVPELPFGVHTTPMPDDADLALLALVTLIAEFLAELDLHQVTLVCNDWGGAQLVISPGGTDRVANLVLVSRKAFDNYPPGLPGQLLCRTAALPGGTALTAQLGVLASYLSPCCPVMALHAVLADQAPLDAARARVSRRSAARKVCCVQAGGNGKASGVAPLAVRGVAPGGQDGTRAMMAAASEQVRVSVRVSAHCGLLAVRRASSRHRRARPAVTTPATVTYNMLRSAHDRLPQAGKPRRPSSGWHAVRSHEI